MAAPARHPLGCVYPRAASDAATHCVVLASDTAVFAHKSGELSAYRAVHGSPGPVEVSPLAQAADSGSIVAMAGGVVAGRPTLVVCRSGAAPSLTIYDVGMGASPVAPITVTRAGGCGLPRLPTAAAFDADNGTIAVGDASGSLQLRHLSDPSRPSWSGSLCGGAGPAVSSIAFWPYNPRILLVTAADTLYRIDTSAPPPPPPAAAAATPAASAAAAAASAAASGVSVYGGGGPWLTCVCLHEDDPHALLCGNEDGAVLQFDGRRPGRPTYVIPAVHDGPVNALAVVNDVSDAEKRSSIISVGDDGACRRIPARTSGSQADAAIGSQLDVATAAASVSRGAPHTQLLQADLPLRSVALLRPRGATALLAQHTSTGLERDVTVLAGGDSGAAHWATVPILATV